MDDGVDDILIGTSRGDGVGDARYVAGESYVVFGGASLTSTIDLANLGSGGITIFGIDASDQSGRSVSGAGDFSTEEMAPTLCVSTERVWGWI